MADSKIEGTNLTFYICFCFSTTLIGTITNLHNENVTITRQECVKVDPS